jgi:hypothetical protein
MNRLKTETAGGFNLFSDDLAFFDASIRESFKGLVSALGITAADSFKINGCVVTLGVNVANWTEGYICLEGEILKVNAGSVVTNSNVGMGLFWGLDISYDASGLSRQNFDTYEVRMGKLIFDNLPGSFMEYNSSYLHQKMFALTTSNEILAKISTSALISKIFAIEDVWHAAALQNGWADIGIGYPVVSYKKDIFNVLWIKGFVNKGVPDTTPIITLPAGYRPLEKRRVGEITINTNGEITDSSGAPAVSLEFSIKL